MGSDDFYFLVMIYTYFLFHLYQKNLLFTHLFHPEEPHFELSKDLRLVQKSRRMDGFAENKGEMATGSRTFPFARNFGRENKLEQEKMTSFPPLPLFQILYCCSCRNPRHQGFISFRYLCRTIASGIYVQRKYGDV
ncbi:hypothetical protein CEXT_148131 [Caerostris extrusa]|uniref:Uncharacterized protein n=1 Tax=Caerostris extrusa TaxID=172846 RepID=A0AAV4S525_CAEEX|nr:hypothetical protein CEXT_148131 [Caerostris extrusa]